MSTTKIDKLGTSIFYMKKLFPILFKELEYLYNLDDLPNKSLKRDVVEESLRIYYNISEKDIRLTLMKKVSVKIGWVPIISLDEGHKKLEIHFYKPLIRKNKNLIMGGNKFSLKGIDRIMAIKYFCFECQRGIGNEIKIFNEKDILLIKTLFSKNTQPLKEKRKKGGKKKRGKPRKC